MNRQELESLPISKKGNSFVSLGDENSDVVSRIQSVISNPVTDLRTYSNRLNIYSVTLRLFDLMDIGFSLQTGQVWSITFRPGYQGRYHDRVGIGDTVADLIRHESLVEFDEQYILVGEGEGNPYGCIMRVNNDEEDIDSLDDVMENRIVEIVVEDHGLQCKRK